MVAVFTLQKRSLLGIATSWHDRIGTERAGLIKQEDASEVTGGLPERNVADDRHIVVDVVARLAGAPDLWGQIASNRAAQHSIRVATGAASNHGQHDEGRAE
jgi:hypothetical protein